MNGEHEHERLARVVTALTTATDTLRSSGKNMVPFGWTSPADEAAFLDTVTAFLEELDVQLHARMPEQARMNPALVEGIRAYAAGLTEPNPECTCNHADGPGPHNVYGCFREDDACNERCDCQQRTGLARTQARAWIETASTGPSSAPFV